jgi:hypothetical protein
LALAFFARFLAFLAFLVDAMPSTELDTEDAAPAEEPDSDPVVVVDVEPPPAPPR